MTISSTSRRTALFTGTGVQTSFPFTFKVQDSDDVVVYMLASDSETTANPATYTVTLNADQNTNPGGSVDFDTAPTSDQQLRITTEADATQELDIQNQASFNPRVVMEAFDKLTILVQQVAERQSRTPLFPITSPPSSNTLPGAEERAGLVMGFSDTGDLAVLQAAALADAQAVVDASWTARLTNVRSKTIPFVRPEWYGAVDYDTDPADYTAELQAAAQAAAAEGRILDLGGLRYGVDQLVLDGLAGLTVRNGGVLKLVPASGEIPVSAEDAAGIRFENFKVDRGTDGTVGSLNVDAGLFLQGCDLATLKGCEFTGYGKGSGALLDHCNDVMVDSSYFHDILYTHVAETDDSVHGLWLRYCNRFIVDNSRFKKLGRVDQTSSSRDRYNRMVPLSGCQGGLIRGNHFYRGDQQIDVTGSGGNVGIVVIGNVGLYAHSHLVKFANSARNCHAIGNTSIGAGLIAYTVSGPVSDQAINPTRDVFFTGNVAINTGASKKQTATNVKGFTAERGTGSSSPYSSYPKNVRFRGNSAVAEIGTGTVTVSSTTLLALSTATPVAFSPGVRANLTASVFPTGTAGATDYWLLPIVDTATFALCNSFDNFLRAYEAYEAGEDYSSYVINTLAGGTTVAVVLQQDMYHGFYTNVATADIDNLAPVTADSSNTVVGATNLAFSGLHTPVSTGQAGATQSVPDSGTTAWNDIVLSGGSETDSMGLLSSGIFIVPYAGLWEAECVAEFAANATGVRRVKVQVNTGGGYGDADVIQSVTNLGGSLETPVTCRHVGWYTRGALIKFQASQNSTGALNLTASTRVRFRPVSAELGTV